MLRKKIAVVSVAIVAMLSFVGCGCEHANSVVLKRDQHCVGTGTIFYKCNDCGKEYKEEAPALGHDYSKLVSDTATCTESGTATYKCTRCGSLKQEKSYAKGHDYDLAKCKRCNAIDKNFKEETVNYKSGECSLKKSDAWLIGRTVGLVQCWYDLIEGSTKIKFKMVASNLRWCGIQVGIILCDGENKFLATKVLSYISNDSSYIKEYEFEMSRPVKEGEKCYYWIDINVVS